MDLSPRTLREVEFREKMRGYHPEDVDQFLEQVAAAVGTLQDRLRAAVERAARAEESAAEAGGSESTLRNTLVLAQRTADLAIQEAREQAARIISAAEQQAQTMLREADDRARRVHEEALADVRSELSRLQANREQAQAGIDVMVRWTDEHRSHLRTTLTDALATIEKAGLITPPPEGTSTRSNHTSATAGLSAPGGRGESGGTQHFDHPAAGTAHGSSLQQPVGGGSSSYQGSQAHPSGSQPLGGASREPGSPAGGVSGTASEETGGPQAPANQAAGADTMAWSVSDEDRAFIGAADTGDHNLKFNEVRTATEEVQAVSPEGNQGGVDEPGPEEQQALDEFFDENDQGEDKRFGGRLRRRR